MTIERPGDAFSPAAEPEEARRRADIADKLGSRRYGLRWRPTSYEVLVDNRHRDPKAPVLLKTRVYDDSEVVTEWRRHESGYAYHVFELDRFDETERTFPVEQGADALSYHAELETAIRERRMVSREIRRRRRNGALLGDLLRDYSADEVVEALGVKAIDRALNDDEAPFPEEDFRAALAEPLTPEDEGATRRAWPAFKARLDEENARRRT